MSDLLNITIVYPFVVVVVVVVVVFIIVYRPPAREVWPNHDVAKFQPWSVTNPSLVSVDYFYKAIINAPHVRP